MADLLNALNKNKKCENIHISLFLSEDITFPFSALQNMNLKHLVKTLKPSS